MTQRRSKEGGRRGKMGIEEGEKDAGGRGIGEGEKQQRR